MKAGWPGVIAAVAFQVLALGYIAGQREWVLHTGRTVWLRTAPVDPRDLMRGDYVRLDYEIGRVPPDRWRDGLATTNLTSPAAKPRRTAMRVYATLAVDRDGLATVTALSDRKPGSGLFLRGYLDASRWGDAAPVRYGLEAFFMEQGRARALETERAQIRAGVPLNLEVAVGGNGIGVLKRYRWESLGLVATFETVRGTNAGAIRPNAIVAATVELKNHGPEPVAIMDLPEGQSYGLLGDARGWVPVYRWAGETNALPVPTARDVIVLQPGQAHASRLDLTRPQWFVMDARTNATPGLPTALQQITPEWPQGFRIEYRPPDREQTASLPNSNLIWHGRLRSRWFTPAGSVD